MSFVVFANRAEGCGGSDHPRRQECAGRRTEQSARPARLQQVPGLGLRRPQYPHRQLRQ